MTVPAGFRLRRDAATQLHAGGRVLVGGSPRRALKLTDRGAAAARRLLGGEPVSGNGEALLARRLLDAGIAHPCPASPQSEPSIEVVVPVLDDVAGLDACLTALGRELPVTVVDDASVDSAGIAAVAARHGARLLRHERNLGPAAARNTGANEGHADLIAFVDSDALVAGSTLRRLAGQLQDPDVAAAAPRVRAAEAGRGLLGVLATHWSPLDMGARPGRVAPAQRIGYVPSTVLVVRRAELVAHGGFDESLRYGEDVDLVWRLAAAGSSVRYDPSLQARHREPRTWAAWLRRRRAYGTSAPTLTLRHADTAAPLFLAPAPAASVAAALSGAPAIAAAIVIGTGWRLGRRLHSADVPVSEAMRGAAMAPVQAGLGAARWAGQLWWPLLLVAARSRRRRTTVVTLMLAPPLVEFAKRRPPVDPVRWVLGLWADDVAYGLGVWRGALRERTLRPVLPRVAAVSRQRPAE